VKGDSGRLSFDENGQLNNKQINDLLAVISSNKSRNYIPKNRTLLDIADLLLVFS